MFKMFDPTYQSMNQIVEENGNILWLGDCTAAYDQNGLEIRGIKTVLTVAAGLNVSYQGQNIIHKVYHIMDIESANISRLFPDTYSQIQDGLKRGSVLVHCAAGVSRSASVVIAYMMRSRNLSFIEAINFVRKKRGVIFPNYGFQRQLRNYERDLKQLKLKEQNEVKQPKKGGIMPPQQSADNTLKDKHDLFKQQYLDQKAKLFIKQKDPILNINLGYSTPQKSYQKQRLLYQSAKVGNQEPKQSWVSNSTRATSSIKQFEYQGPHIVTHFRNKLIGDKNAMPELRKPSAQFYK